MPEIDEDQLFLLSDRVERYAKLIHWLALPWQSNDPDFSAYDHYTGAALEQNVELEDTWFEAVRGGVRPVPVKEKVLAVCPHCHGTTKNYSGDTDEFTTCTTCNGVGTLEVTKV